MTTTPTLRRYAPALSGTSGDYRVPSCDGTGAGGWSNLRFPSIRAA